MQVLSANCSNGCWQHVVNLTSYWALAGPFSKSLSSIVRTFHCYPLLFLPITSYSLSFAFTIFMHLFNRRHLRSKSTLTQVSLVLQHAPLGVVASSWLSGGGNDVLWQLSEWVIVGIYVCTYLLRGTGHNNRRDNRIQLLLLQPNSKFTWVTRPCHIVVGVLVAGERVLVSYKSVA